jgi:AcrR family transcriptional regulator
MPRVPSEERLASLAQAATRVFGRLGYRGTRMADVASEAGMSSGSVFTYVESKEALFHLVFLHGFGLLDQRAPDLPLPTPEPGETVKVIEESLRTIPIPALREALRHEQPVDIAEEFRGIIEERYSIQERLWPIFAVIERSAVEIPEIEEFYFGRTRVGYFRTFAGYLEQRMGDGYLRKMPDAAVTARLISEAISWFAWHRHEGRDADLYDDRTARDTVVEFTSAALLGSPR